VTFSPNGRLLASGSPDMFGRKDEVVHVWQLTTAKEIGTFRGHERPVFAVAFSPDSTKLVTGSGDATALIWDLSAVGRSRPIAAGEGPPVGRAPGPRELEAAWADLAGADAARAFRARWALGSSPEEAVALLKGRLRRAQADDPQRLRRLLDGLNSDQFAVRTKAQAGLEELGDLAEQALRQALAGKPTLEMRRRLETALERMRVPVTRPELLRPLRAVAVLEDIGTPAAWELLKELASGAPEARLTREAAASLGRLARRTPARR